MRKAKIGVQNESRGKGVSSAKCRAVSVAVPVAGIAAAANRRALHNSPESCWREVGIVQKTEAPEHIHFIADVPINLAVDSVPVERKTARSKVVVLHARQVRLGKQ